MPVLKIYNEDKELILVSQEFHGDKGWGLLTDLLPNTTYEEGTYFVSWEDKNYETEKIPVPRFTTESSTNKELVFYFKDALTVKPMTAYDIAVKNGFSGTEKEWVESIKGEPGVPGVDATEGGSAYDYWLAQGNKGSKEDFLFSLKGKDGRDGLSAYQIAVEEGFEGREDEWLRSLKGEHGEKGEPGADGASAYEIALENGFVGNIQDFLDSLVGKPGRDGQDGYDGLTAYQIAKEYGYKGTEQEWLNSLKGEKGKDFKFSDFTTEQLKQIKGEKGDPFTYQDFTEEQKQEIKGLDEDEVKSLIDEPFKQSIEDPYYDEITYDKFFEETSKSIYYVVNIPHKDKNGDIIKLKTSKPKEPTTAREVSEKYQPSAIINASVFNTSTLEPSGVQIEDGQIIGDKKSGTLRTLGIRDDNTLVDFTSDVRAQEILDMGIKNTVTAFYPIKNGEDKPYKDIENASSNINERHPRQVIAQKENKDLMFITIEGRNGDSEGMNYDDMYRVCESLGASYAYCLDGGGSTQTLVRGNLINKQVDGGGMKERVVPDFLYVDKKVDNKKSIKSYNYDIGKITKILTEMLYKSSNSKGIPNKVDIATDLNSIKETGLYWVGKSAKGSPGDMSYAIIHFQVYDNAALQIAIPYHESLSNILFRRTVGSGDTNTWRDWRPNNTTTWSGLTFETGWSNYGNGEPGLGYSIQGNKVYIKGTVKGSSSNNIITTLPGDIIPKIVVISPTTSKQGDEYKASAIKISTNGEVEIINPSTEWNLVSLTYPL